MSRPQNLFVVAILLFIWTIWGCSGINETREGTASICTLKQHTGEAVLLSKSSSGLVVVWYDDPVRPFSVTDSVAASSTRQSDR